MRLGIFQVKPLEDFCKNCERLQNLIKNSKAEVLVFPELALTGYKLEQFELSSLNLFQELILDCLKRLQRVISEGQTLLIGAPGVREEELRNCVYMVTSSDVEVVSEKLMLFPGIDDVFRPGRVKKVLKIGNVKIGIILCFELRSPEVFRYFLKEGVEAFFVVAEWPVSRLNHWKTLLSARAIENKSFVVGVNSLGGSCVIAPDGTVVKELSLEEEVLEVEMEFLTPELPYPLRTPFVNPQQNKVKALEELKEISQIRQSKGQKMVFTNGCFDILHAGHVDYLEKARALGDFLVVGLNSDKSIKKIKGKKRPVNPEALRAKVLSGLKCVDYIVIFEEETPERLIKELKPDILVKGADWEEDKIVGATFVKSYGGEVHRIEFTFNTSTTNIIEKILSNLVK